MLQPQRTHPFYGPRCNQLSRRRPDRHVAVGGIDFDWRSAGVDLSAGAARRLIAERLELEFAEIDRTVVDGCVEIGVRLDWQREVHVSVNRANIDEIPA